ncbi:MAG: MmgE/PrpD family protein [Chloroflexi bacterium]|nr:MmgE/PrpD family protein [Chloroflexota bacterium]
MTVARELARVALETKFDRLPPEVVHETKRITLDALACAIGGYASPASAIIQQVIREDFGGKVEATIFGSGYRTSCLNATLANGVMIRVLDYNDAYAVPVGPMVSGGHPSDTLSGIFAVGEREHNNGREIIEAIVAAYELGMRFCDCVGKIPWENRGWNADTRGAFVMPAVVGKLFGLNEDQLEQAIGISGSHNMVLGILDAPGEEYTMTKNLRFPRTSYGGIWSALLARRGFTGPTRAFEGSRGLLEALFQGDFQTDKMLQELVDLREGRGQWKTLETRYKAFCCDGTTHGHLSATLAIVKEHDLKPEDVERIWVRATSRDREHTGDEAKKYPKNKESADHSSYYLTAIMIKDRAVGPAQYTPEKYNDPQVRELIDKIQFDAEPELDRFAAAGIVEITIKQGAKYTARVEHPKGDPENQMSDQEIEAKFRDMARGYLSKQQTDDVVSTVNRLDKLSDIGELIQKVVFAKR